MSGLLFLTTEDFQVKQLPQNPNKQVLATAIRGISLILFYTTECHHCKNLMPIFKYLPGTVNGCQYGMVNVFKNKKLIERAKETIAPITYVPYILLYHNGYPYIRYNGPYDRISITNFVVSVADNIFRNQSFAPNVVKKEDRPIPEYCIAKPKCDELVCYLNIADAYDHASDGKKF